MNLKSLLQKNKFWFLLITIIASIFRIFSINLMEFKFDEANTLFNVNEFFIKPYIINNSGFSSIGVHNFPLFYYLIAILAIPSRDPQYITFTIALINTIMIGAFFLFARRFYGLTVSIFSSLFLALAPWSIIYSRKIWAIDLILPLLIPFFYFIHNLIIDKKPKSIFYASILLTLLIQLHLSGIFLALSTITILIILKIKINLKYVIAGICVGLLPSIPYFINQFLSNPFCPDCILFFQYLKTIRSFDLWNFIRPFQIMNGYYFDNLLGSDYANFTKMFPIVNFSNIIFSLDYFLPIIGVYYILRENRKYLFLTIYAFAIPVLYLITKTPADIHYFVIMIPIMVIFYSLGIYYLLNLSHKNVFLKILIIFFFIISLSANFIFDFSLFKFISIKQDIKGDYGNTFSLSQKIIEGYTQKYSFLPYYDQLKLYSYPYAKSSNIHKILGDYFIKTGHAELAITELLQAINIDPADVFSRSNLAYIYILSKQFKEANYHISILENYDSTTSSKLKQLLEQTLN